MMQGNFEKLLEKFELYNSVASLPLRGSSDCRAGAAFLQHSGLTSSHLTPGAYDFITPQIYRQQL